MAKRTLSQLLDTSIGEPAVGESVAGAPSEVPPAPANLTWAETPTAAASPSAPSSDRRRTPAKPRVPARTGPRYLELDRKELRIRGDQADDLSALTRQINRLRSGPGERITDNTLIRVAIDLLLRDRDRLHGSTEADLLKSVLPD